MDASSYVGSQPSENVFLVGYHRIHSDVTLNYQMNRFSTGAPDMIAEMRAVAPKIRSYTDHIREFSALAQQALQKGEILKGAYYLRCAEFFMFPGDHRKEAARVEFISLMRQQFQVSDDTHHSIPYGAQKLSSYRFTGPSSRGTIVLFGGFDSNVEEWFPMQLYFRAAGFDVVTFEGPGQGAVLEVEHLPMTLEWDKPVRAVLDYFQLDDVTLMGISFGGCLVLRAAAFEPRVSRVVADDIFTDLLDVSLRQSPVAVRTTIGALISVKAEHLVNAMVERAMKRSLAVEWGVRQGMHILGASSPYEYFRRACRYQTRDVSPLVRQDVLLLAGAEDHYVPLRQFYSQIQTLTSVRSLTARLFTRAEAAQNHVHIGNIGLSLRVITDWIIERQSHATP
jgi:pimeloyl-ACP methyl ester carboxylesterase